MNNNNTSISIYTGTIVRAVLVVLGVMTLWFLQDLLLVIVTSIIIASFMEALIPYFKRIKIGRATAVVICYVLGLAIFAGLFYLFAPLLITEVYNFATVMSKYVPGVEFLDYFKSEQFSGAKDVVANLNNNVSVSSLLKVSQSFIINLSGGFFQTISVAFGSIFNFILIVVISFYLSLEEKGIENFLRIILPIKYENYAIDLWNRSRHKIALWMKGQMIIALIVAVLIYLLLTLAGMPYALLLALIAGIMQLVPYGIIIALIPAISFAFLSGGLSSVLIVAGSYIIVHVFENVLITPLIIKGVVGVSPLVVILSVLVGYELAGFWGLIIAIPVAVVLLEFMNDIEKRKILIRKASEEK
jgi:predicted PurR-regulated permease PerM